MYVDIRWFFGGLRQEILPYMLPVRGIPWKVASCTTIPLQSTHLFQTHFIFFRPPTPTTLHTPVATFSSGSISN